MKRLALAVVLSSAVFAVSAQAPMVEPATPAADAVVAPTDTPVASGDAAPADTARDSAANCIQQTGSRVRVKNQAGKCNGEPGSAYTREDIRRTARGDLGDALRTLDTSIF